MWENDKTMNSFNGAGEADTLQNAMNTIYQYYATNDMLMYMGMDFNYMNAFQNYENMDRMIEYMNNNMDGKYIFKYSSVGEYVDALNAKNITWTTKTADLFPYADDYDSWWTGYFSSRATAKSFVRKGSHIFHASS
jgi:lysosomal alpha-mannosidase